MFLHLYSSKASIIGLFSVLCTHKTIYKAVTSRIVCCVVDLLILKSFLGKCLRIICNVGPFMRNKFWMIGVFLNPVCWKTLSFDAICEINNCPFLIQETVIGGHVWKKSGCTSQWCYSLPRTVGYVEHSVNVIKPCNCNKGSKVFIHVVGEQVVHWYTYV